MVVVMVWNRNDPCNQKIQPAWAAANLRPLTPTYPIPSRLSCNSHNLFPPLLILILLINFLLFFLQPCLFLISFSFLLTIPKLQVVSVASKPTPSSSGSIATARFWRYARLFVVGFGCVRVELMGSGFLGSPLARSDRLVAFRSIEVGEEERSNTGLWNLRDWIEYYTRKRMMSKGRWFYLIQNF